MRVSQVEYHLLHPQTQSHRHRRVLDRENHYIIAVTTKYFFHSHGQILLPVSKVAPLPPKNKLAHQF